MLELVKNVFAIDCCTYLKASKTLVICDLHIGFEEALGRQGVLVPRVQFKDMIARLEWIFKHAKIERVVLNGDVKHEFGRISNQEWREVTRLMEFFKKKQVEVIAVKGNHDTIFGPLARKLNIKEVPELIDDGVQIVHGDEVPKKLSKVILMGHEHPAIVLREKAKSEKFKCFVKTTYKQSTIIVQPSFNPLTKGTDVLEGSLLSPLLPNLKKGEVFIVNEESHEVLNFGKVSKWV